LNQIERADVFGDLSQFRDAAAEAVEAVKRTLNRVPLMKAQGGGGQKAAHLCVCTRLLNSLVLGLYVIRVRAVKLTL